MAFSQLIICRSKNNNLSQKWYSLSVLLPSPTICTVNHVWDERKALKNILIFVVLDGKTTGMRSYIPTERKGEMFAMSLICAADKPSSSGWDWFYIHAVSLPQGECCLSPSYFPSRIHDLLSIKISRVRINLSHRRAHTQTHTPAPRKKDKSDREGKEIIEKRDKE